MYALQNLNQVITNQNLPHCGSSFLSQERCRMLRLGEIPSRSNDYFQKFHHNSNNNNDPTRNDERCSNRTKNNDNQIAIVHAYADQSYDRSSFHIAGNANLVADVASSIALDAIDKLQSFHVHNDKGGDGDNDDNDNETSERMDYHIDDSNNKRHPLIGLVDHISVMPLVDEQYEHDHEHEHTLQPQNKEECINTKSDDQYVPPDSHGLCSVFIGNQLKKHGINVLYYGSAHPNQSPLALIRKEKTKFFQSGGLLQSQNNDGVQKEETATDQCTVGSPAQFAENFNILLSKHISKKKAIGLAKLLRARDGGIPGVEALTLPYSAERYEVACNLLCPVEGSAQDMSKVLDEWMAREQKEYKINSGIDCNQDYFVDSAYRVGTTAQQCIDVLHLFDTKVHVGMDDYERTLLKKFHQYLTKEC